MEFKDIKDLDDIRGLLPKGHPALLIAEEGEKIPPESIFLLGLEASEKDKKRALEICEKLRKLSKEKARPKLVSNPNISDLLKRAEAYLDEVEGDHVDDDTEHYLFESVMETFYGKDVWLWVNNNLC